MGEIDTVSLSNKKLVKIILNKALPMMGLVLWWNKPFTHVPEIDTQKDIVDRKVEKVTNTINKDSEDILEIDDSSVKSDTSINSSKEREIDDHFKEMLEQDDTHVKSKMKAVWDEAHIKF